MHDTEMILKTNHGDKEIKNSYAKEQLKKKKVNAVREMRENGEFFKPLRTRSADCVRVT